MFFHRSDGDLASRKMLTILIQATKATETVMLFIKAFDSHKSLCYSNLISKDFDGGRKNRFGRNLESYFL